SASGAVRALATYLSTTSGTGATAGTVSAHGATISSRARLLNSSMRSGCAHRPPATWWLRHAVPAASSSRLLAGAVGGACGADNAGPACSPPPLAIRRGGGGERTGGDHALPGTQDASGLHKTGVSL
ncbi:Protein of unknown function, partial [Gryllus bimaculatus]